MHCPSHQPVDCSCSIAKAALFGTMRHELFERCMSNQDFGWPTAKVFATNIVRRNAESLVGCGIRESEARAEVLKVVPQIQRFAAQYTTFIDKARSSKSNALGALLKGNGMQPDMQFVANSVQATEEAIVCPELGLKGNLDVTVSAMTSSLPSTHGIQTSTSAGVPQSSLLSIELKTGHNQNPQNAHMAQLALYTMMLRVRRGPNRPHSPLSQGTSQETQGACESGMLLYLNHENYRALHVSPMLNEIKSLVGQRNLIASELTKAARPRGVVLAYEDQGNTNATGEKDNQRQRKPRYVRTRTLRGSNAQTDCASECLIAVASTPRNKHQSAPRLSCGPPGSLSNVASVLQMLHES